MIATPRANVRRYPGWIMLLELIVQKRTDMRKLQYRKYKHRSYDQRDSPVEPGQGSIRGLFRQSQRGLEATEDLICIGHCECRDPKAQEQQAQRPRFGGKIIRWQDGRPQVSR